MLREHLQISKLVEQPKCELTLNDRSMYISFLRYFLNPTIHDIYIVHIEKDY
jgi:hypothetical protein